MRPKKTQFQNIHSKYVCKLREKFYLPVEVAEMLSVNPITVISWGVKGMHGIPTPKRIYRRFFFKKAQIDHFFKKLQKEIEGWV